MGITRTEALEILRNLLKELTKDFDALTEEEHEAYNMALSSLEIDGMYDMSRKEAIELLDNLIGMVDDNHGSDYDTALHMAINSLKVDEAYQLKYEHIPTITITVEEYIRLRECETRNISANTTSSTWKSARLISASITKHEEPRF